MVNPPEPPQMYLWLCWFEFEDWCVFVTAPTRGKAKSMVFSYFHNDICFLNFTDIHAIKKKAADGYPAKVYDEDCPELEELGYAFMTEGEPWYE